ncbi:MAG: dTDP-glucose 4,6-dehydratase [Gemmataceae bacterium]
MSVATVLVTGGCGFIGSNYVRMVLEKEAATRVINLDALTYAGNPANLNDCESNPNYRLVVCDIADRSAVEKVFAEHKPDEVVHFAAESHVDRSILDSSPFIRTNVQGTQVLLDVSRASGVKRYVQVSTDEVYGSLGDTGFFTEETPLAPNSPYAASKAASDLLVRAYVHTHGFPAIITRSSNNYGPYQFPEKLIPLFISNLQADQPVPVYGDGMQVRDWIHVLDHCQGIHAALRKGKPGNVYNFGGRCEKPNIELTKALLQLLGKPETLIRYVADRPGHDRRYAIDCAFAERELGWRPTTRFEEGLRATVAWYRENRTWVDAIKSGAYRQYYQAQYGHRGL